MPANLLDLPYEIIRLLTCHLPLIETLRLSECCLRLVSLFDYNHDPRLDDQRAVDRATVVNCVHIIKKLVLVEHIDVRQILIWACTVGEEEFAKQLLFKPRINSACIDSAFIKAASNGHASIIQLMMNVSAVDRNYNYDAAELLESERCPD
jgi:hypothetical protein